MIKDGRHLSLSVHSRLLQSPAHAGLLKNDMLICKALRVNHSSSCRISYRMESTYSDPCLQHGFGASVSMQRSPTAELFPAGGTQGTGRIGEGVRAWPTVDFVQKMEESQFNGSAPVCFLFFSLSLRRETVQGERWWKAGGEKGGAKESGCQAPS